MSDPNYIDDKKKRSVTYCKRKRGLIKKMIELSKLCNQDICMAIFDNSRQRIIKFQTSDKFTFGIADDLTKDPFV